MMSKKYSLNPWLLALLWLGMFALSGLFVLSLIVVATQIFLNVKPLGGIDTVLVIGIMLLFPVCAYLWRKATFRRVDFVRLLQRLGVRDIRNKFRYSCWDVISTHSFVDGYIGEDYLVGRVDSPFFAFSPGPGISLRKYLKTEDKRERGKYMIGGYTPAYMKKNSQVAFFSLLEGPLRFDFEVGDGVKKISKTGNEDLDRIIDEILAGDLSMSMRLKFDESGFKVEVVSGSWEGELFRNKIQSAFKIFKKIVEKLEVKCLKKSWDDWHVIFDINDDTFKLMPRTFNSAM